MASPRQASGSPGLDLGGCMAPLCADERERQTGEPRIAFCEQTDPKSAASSHLPLSRSREHTSRGSRELTDPFREAFPAAGEHGPAHAHPRAPRAGARGPRRGGGRQVAPDGERHPD